MIKYSFENERVSPDGPFIGPAEEIRGKKNNKKCLGLPLDYVGLR